MRIFRNILTHTHRYSTYIHIHTCLWGGGGQLQMGHRGAGQGAGRKIGGNNYLHTSQSLISLGKCLTDVPKPLFPRITSAVQPFYSLQSFQGFKVNSLLINFSHVQYLSLHTYVEEPVVWSTSRTCSTLLGSDSFDGALHSHGYRGNCKLCWRSSAKVWIEFVNATVVNEKITKGGWVSLSHPGAFTCHQAQNIPYSFFSGWHLAFPCY